MKSRMGFLGSVPRTLIHCSIPLMVTAFASLMLPGGRLWERSMTARGSGALAAALSWVASSRETAIHFMALESLQFLWATTLAPRCSSVTIGEPAA